MNKTIFVFAVVVALQGCSTPQQAPLAPRSTSEFITIPEINQEARAEIGQTIISRALVTRTPAIVVLKEIYDPVSTIPLPVGVYSLARATELGKFYEVGSEPINIASDKVRNVLLFGVAGLLSSGEMTEYRSIGVFVPIDASKHPAVYVGDGSIVGKRSIKDKIQFTQKEEVREGSFKRELIYTGISQNTLSILYREFKNDFARPAFTQDIKYDLSQSKIIGYKGARFEVVSVSNTEIVYRVLKTID